MQITATTSSLPAPTDRPAAEERLAVLDQLRGLAALVVVVAHASARVSPTAAALLFGWFDLGHFGVILFFLCSGFIIPVSLERHGSLGRFWLRRVCRLYPLYWLSIALVLLGYGSGWLTPQDQLALPASYSRLVAQPLATILANLTMLQGFVGVPGLLGVYWTLFYEMLFYLLVSLLFLAGLHRHTAVTATWFALTACAAHLLPTLLGGGRAFPTELLSYPALMWSGTLLYRMQQRTIAPRQAAPVLALVLAMLLLTTEADESAVSAAPAALHLLSARLAACLLFGAAIWRGGWRSGPLAAAADRLGSWSYSLYLLHSFVFALVPPLSWPPLTVALWTAGTIGVAALSYRWVERPAIALGRTLTTRRAIGAH